VGGIKRGGLGLTRGALAAELLLIRQLGDGGFHSGEALGQVLGVSRAAVWKRLQSLSRLGLDVERVRGKGYRLAGGVSLLDPEAITAGLAEAAAGVTLDVRAETVSTNMDALAHARDTLPQPVAVLAEYQTAGRGRRGRAWQMPFAAGLAVSLAVEFPGGASRLEGLSLAVGACLAELLVEQGVQGVGLKWPNDILVGERKLGGVLIELAGDLDASCRAVIGVGLNMSLPQTLVVDQPVTDLRAELGPLPDRNVWAVRVLSALLAMSEQFREQGFAPFRSRWEAYDLSRDRPVTVLRNATQTEGVARGVSTTGALYVETPEGMTELHGGEISLRLG